MSKALTLRFSKLSNKQSSNLRFSKLSNKQRSNFKIL